MSCANFLLSVTASLSLAVWHVAGNIKLVSYTREAKCKRLLAEGTIT